MPGKFLLDANIVNFTLLGAGFVLFCFVLFVLINIREFGFGIQLNYLETN